MKILPIVMSLVLRAVAADGFSVPGGLESSKQLAGTSRLTKTAPFRVGRGGALKAESANVDTRVDLIPSTFNLIKNIVGAGVLSLPYGVAAFTDSKGGILPACALVLVLGALSCYSFILIGRLCEMTDTQTYKGAVGKAMGDTSGKLLVAATTLKTFVGCLMYSIIIGDTSAALAGTVGATEAFPLLFSSRWKILTVITTAVLTPLCLLRSFSFLAYTSLLGIGGTLYTAVFMGMRMLDGSYAPGGRFHADLAAAAGASASSVLPSFGAATKPAGLFVLLSMLSTAFVAHYNAPRFFSDLKESTVKRFSVLSVAAFGAAAAIFGSMMSFGFLTFGAATKGYVLNNYAATDPLATVARAAILLSIMLGYPLAFVGFRDSVIEIARGGSSSGAGDVSWRTKDVVGVALLSFITVLATFVRNLGLVASVGGALLGSAVIFIFPSLSFLAVAKKDAGVDLTQEVRVNYGLTAIGVLLAIIGTAVSLKTA